MNVSNNGIEFLKKHEGLRLTPYKDGGKYSIGYGHQIQPTESELHQGITKAKAEELLRNDIDWAEGVVNRVITTTITQNQFDALVSLCYNIGATAFGGSTLVRMINDHSPADVIEKQWTAHYITSDGHFLQALADRRAEEAEMFFTPYDTSTAASFIKNPAFKTAFIFIFIAIAVVVMYKYKLISI